MTRTWNGLALALIAALSVPVTPSYSASRLADRDTGPQWPSVSVPEAGPQWPNIGKDDTGPQWPNLPPVGKDEPRYPGLPAPSVQIGLDKDLNAIAGKSTPKDDLDVTNATPRSNRTNRSVMTEPSLEASAAQWPVLPQAEPQSRFKFEIGTRYWYSGGNVRFGFTNMNPNFGSPTSTLDWRGLEAHTGEVFARLDHTSSGFFVKGVAGMGAITRGRMDDRDYFLQQILFSDTTSDVKGSPVTFATIDFGWGYKPMPGMWIGGFIGYHYWREKMTGYGLICNAIDPRLIGGCTPGSVEFGFETPVIIYEPTWHALRLGFESKVAIDDRWSVNGEIVGIPFAMVENKDSHLMRTDLGPSPNIITKSSAGYGVQAEVFVNYALTPNIEVGGGLRYWQFVTQHGQTTFTGLGNSFPIDRFEQTRYGVLLHVKGKF
ncbi:MAG: hypothetical protein AB1490_26525 [Pseudomonadota bacterium]